jgi:hypothetical protein
MWLLKVYFSGLFPAKEEKAVYSRNVRRFFRFFVALLNAFCKGSISSCLFRPEYDGDPRKLSTAPG